MVNVNKILCIGILSSLLLSCTTTKIKIFDKDRTIQEIVKVNKWNIDKLDLKGTIDFTNKEINAYKVKKMNLESVPKLILDIDLSKARSDGFIIRDKVDGSLNVEFQNLTERAKTTNKKIPFLIVPLDSKLIVNLSKDISLDNTLYKIEEKYEKYAKVYYLVPKFKNQDVIYEKLKNKSIIDTNLAYYDEDYIVNYKTIENKNGKIYSEITGKLINAKNKNSIMKGIYFGKEVVLKIGDFRLSTKVKNNKWEFLLPINGKAIIYGIDMNGNKSVEKTIEWSDKNEITYVQ
ncbi:hypothetical protein [Sneathia sanguinegens]|jgi:hypothetical protein|uniref:hypothetical protein n=1 Tax=Sneathia sanguinegens TaxID=40543 RepID=UPI00258A84F9|nr:hypothetical protein [Sneathia sanguinegens]MDU4652163.1 hypothetical protein [Sneathia sanguinegens]